MTIESGIGSDYRHRLESRDRPTEWTAGMTIEQVLEIWTPANLAKVLDTSIQNVCHWLSDGRIPRGRQYELQVKSGGRLIAVGFDAGRDYVTGGRQRQRDTR